jgi:hypothetical protein
MKTNKDIQEELFALIQDMDIQNVYSQITFFLASLAGSKECPWTSGHQMAMIIGMLSDSYLGMYINEHVKNNNEADV